VPRFQRVAARLAELRERFPKTFFPDDAPSPWPPLATGVHREIAIRAPDLAVPKTLLRLALRFYVRRWAYRDGLVEGAVRIDLDGADAGLVTRGEIEALAMRQRVRL
jgi:ProP effector